LQESFKNVGKFKYVKMCGKDRKNKIIFTKKLRAD
jgi:hypothetical protein